MDHDQLRLEFIKTSLKLTKPTNACPFNFFINAIHIHNTLLLINFYFSNNFVVITSWDSNLGYQRD